MDAALEVQILRLNYCYQPSGQLQQEGRDRQVFCPQTAGWRFFSQETQRARQHTRRTISPLTNWAAGMVSIVLLRTTRHDGGIMARKEAKMASDFCS